MEKDLIKLEGILEKDMPIIVEAIEKADATSEDYGKLLNNFNSTMVIYSQLQEMFMRAAMATQSKEEQVKEEN